MTGRACRTAAALGAALAVLAARPATLAATPPAPVPGVARAVMPPGLVIRVRGLSGDTVVHLVASPGGGRVRADVMARLLGGVLDSVAIGRWRLGLYGATLELLDGLPYAAYNGFPLPLSEPVAVADGAPLVPLHLFSEIIPRFGIGILWDRSRWEVRLFQGIARRALPAGTPDPAPTPAPPAVTVAATVDAGRTPTPAPEAPALPAATGVSAGAGTPDPDAPLSRRYKVIVDAGHGGVDPGNPGTVVNGRRVREAQLTLAIALKLEQELKRRGLDVYLTRRTDTLIARDDRGKIANAQHGDLFISIHTNAANPAWRDAAAARGFETYFLSTARTEDERRVAAMENDVVRFETAAAPRDGDPLAFILADLAQNEHLRESSELAALIQQRLDGTHPGPNRGVKQAGFAVLARAYMPAVLVEIGFGTNRADAAWMASAAGQTDAARSIAAAALEYLQHYDRRTRATSR